MDHYKIDFSKVRADLTESDAPLATQPPDLPRQPRPRRPWSRKRIAIILVIVFVVFYFSSTVFAFFSSFGQNDQGQSLSLWSGFKHLISSDDKTLAGEKEDRINFLLLGQGGAGHDGPYLTDTIMLASFQPSTGKVALVAMPRDMVIPIPGYGWRRINYVNAYGEQERPGQGAAFAAATLGGVLQLPIHYYLRVDFGGFIEFIDDLGGIKICVDTAFTDYQYPTDDYQYQTVAFDDGCQIMDGNTALQYARSRHGNNSEGSDFARSQRQQKIILGVKDKVLSFQTILNPLTLRRIIDKFTDHISTNMEVWQMLQLAKMGRGVSKDQITTLGITVDGPNALLEVVIGEDGAFLLQPPGGNYDTIRNILGTVFSSTITPLATTAVTGEPTPPPPPPAEPVKQPDGLSAAVKEKASIGIFNGTFIVGLASKTKDQLVAKGFNVAAAGNAPTRDYQQTTLYQITDKPIAATFAWLQKIFSASIETTVPTWLANQATTDIVIILSETADRLSW